MNVLFVSPVTRKSPQGREKQTYAYVGNNGQIEFGQQKRQDRSEKATTRLMFCGDYNKQQYVTGLDEMVTNPFYGSTDASIPDKFRQAETIKLQHVYELQEGMPIDTLQTRLTQFIFNTVNRPDAIENKASYIGNFSVDLYARTNRFDDTTIRGKLAIMLLKNHPKVASSKDVANPAVHHFYISEENEDIQELMRKTDLVEQVIAEKVNLQQNSSEFKCYQVASLCLYKNGNPCVIGNANHTTVKTQLSAYLDSNSKNFKDNATKFLSLIEMIKDKKEKDRFYVKYIIQQAINSRVFDVRDGWIYWPSKSGEPNMGKHNNALKLENLLLSEYVVFDPSNDASNWFGDLLKECVNKGVRVE